MQFRGILIMNYWDIYESVLAIEASSAEKCFDARGETFV